MPAVREETMMPMQATQAVKGRESTFEVHTLTSNCAEEVISARQPRPVTGKVSPRPFFQRPHSDVPRDKVTILTAPDVSCSSPNPYSLSPPFSRLQLVGKVHWSSTRDPSPSWRLQLRSLRRPSSGSQRWGQHLPPVLLSHGADITFAKQGDQERLEVKVKVGMESASADHADDLQPST